MNLRGALRNISHELGLKGQYTYEEVIRELRVRHSNLIIAESRKLETMALRRMLSDVEARQTKTNRTLQGELFPELAGFPGSYDARSVGLTDKKGVRVLLQLLSIKSVRQISNYSETPRKNDSLQARLKSCLDVLSPHIQSDDEVFCDVIRRSRK